MVLFFSPLRSLRLCVNISREAAKTAKEEKKIDINPCAIFFSNVFLELPHKLSNKNQFNRCPAFPAVGTFEEIYVKRSFSS